MSHAATATHSEPHPIRTYFVVWGWLFVLSTFSYLVDFFHVQGYLRWALILLFMALKAGLIIAFFMHMAWERLTLAFAILVPPILVVIFMVLMIFEADYTLLLRREFLGAGAS